MSPNPPAVTTEATRVVTCVNCSTARATLTMTRDDQGPAWYTLYCEECAHAIGRMLSNADIGYTVTPLP